MARAFLLIAVMVSAIATWSVRGHTQSGPERAPDLVNHPFFEGDIELYKEVVSQVASVLLHEMGHAVHYEMDAPFTGRREDVADDFVVYHVNQQIKALGRPDLAEVVFRGVGLFEKMFRYMRNGNVAQFDWYDEHSFDLARAARSRCSIAGLLLETNEYMAAYLADQLQLSHVRLAKCKQEAQDVVRAFAVLLESHVEKSPGAGGGTFTVNYQATQDAAQAQAIDAIRKSGLFEDIAAQMDAEFRWPRQLDVIVGPCGTINAFYSKDKAAVIYCAEMLIAQKQMSQMDLDVGRITQFLAGSWRNVRGDWYQGQVEEIVTFNPDGSFTSVERNGFGQGAQWRGQFFVTPAPAIVFVVDNNGQQQQIVRELKVLDENRVLTRQEGGQWAESVRVQS